MTDNRCAHCLIDHRGEQRYAALPGLHDWTREPTPSERIEQQPMPSGEWWRAVLAAQRHS